MGALDVVPAATLLVPYFEVDADPETSSVTTELTIVNHETTSICLAHATLWTDLGIPTVNFNVQIPPGGVVEIDLYDLFADGELPFPAFGDTCESLDEEMPTSASDLLAAHTGRSSSGLFGGQCGAVARSDRLARGFITIDAVDDCTDRTPRDATYFTSDASEANVLFGTYAIRRTSPPSATGAPMVHVEADSAQVGLESFYYRFQPVPSTADGREPLPQRWSVPFYNDLSDVICWRDQLFAAPFECDFGLLPIPDKEVVAYDHAGLPFFPPVTLSPCTIASSMLRAGSEAFPLEAKTGTLFVDVDQTDVAIPVGVFEPRAQACMSVVHRLHPQGLTVHVPGKGVSTFAPPILLQESGQ
jgi:hypothetical protein